MPCGAHSCPWAPSKAAGRWDPLALGPQGLEPESGDREDIGGHNKVRNLVPGSIVPRGFTWDTWTGVATVMATASGSRLC